MPRSATPPGELWRVGAVVSRSPFMSRVRARITMHWVGWQGDNSGTFFLSRGNNLNRPTSAIRVRQIKCRTNVMQLSSHISHYSHYFPRSLSFYLHALNRALRINFPFLVPVKYQALQAPNGEVEPIPSPSTSNAGFAIPLFMNSVGPLDDISVSFSLRLCKTHLSI